MRLLGRFFKSSSSQYSPDDNNSSNNNATISSSSNFDTQQQQLQQQSFDTRITPSGSKIIDSTSTNSNSNGNFSTFKSARKWFNRSNSGNESSPLASSSHAPPPAPHPPAMPSLPPQFQSQSQISSAAPPPPPPPPVKSRLQSSSQPSSISDTRALFKLQSSRRTSSTAQLFPLPTSSAPVSYPMVNESPASSLSGGPMTPSTASDEIALGMLKIDPIIKKKVSFSTLTPIAPENNLPMTLPMSPPQQQQQQNAWAMAHYQATLIAQKAYLDSLSNAWETQSMAGGGAGRTSSIYGGSVGPGSFHPQQFSFPQQQQMFYMPAMSDAGFPQSASSRRLNNQRSTASLRERSSIISMPSDMRTSSSSRFAPQPFQSQPNTPRSRARISTHMSSSSLALPNSGSTINVVPPTAWRSNTAPGSSMALSNIQKQGQPQHPPMPSPTKIRQNSAPGPGATGGRSAGFTRSRIQSSSQVSLLPSNLASNRISAYA